MEHPLKTLWEKPSRLVIGFMSGTSADGVDAALVRITGYGTQTRAEQLGFRFVPFSDEVRAEILRLAGGGPASAADFCRMNFLLGELFCEAGEALCAQTGTKLSDIDLIGSHGQTFWHIPEKEEYLSRTFASTFQLGEEAVLAERFGCPVVGNFRVRDVAAGGSARRSCRIRSFCSTAARPNTRRSRISAASGTSRCSRRGALFPT